MVPLTKVVAASDCADTALGTTPLRRANPSQQRPARRIAGRESFFQPFINPLLGGRGLQHICWMLPSLAPGNHGLPPMPLDGAGHHATGRAAVAPGRSLNRDRNLNARMIRATPNTSEKAPSHQVRTTAPAKGASIIKMPKAVAAAPPSMSHQRPSSVRTAAASIKQPVTIDQAAMSSTKAKTVSPGQRKARTAVTMLAAP